MRTAVREDTGPDIGSQKLFESTTLPTMAADIAVVSFERFLQGDADDKHAVAQEIYDAFSSVGWVYVKDHGIPQERVDEIFTLVWIDPWLLASQD